MRHLSLKPIPSSRCRMEWFLVCPGVSARFLHGFCTVTQDARVDFRCKIWHRMHKLYVQKSRWLALKRRCNEAYINWDMCHACAFNQRARDSSSLERTKEKPTIDRWKSGFDRGFLFVISARQKAKSATEMRQRQGGLHGRTGWVTGAFD